MRVKVLRVTRKPILATELRELAGPVRQHKRTALICQSRVKRPVRLVHTTADKPAPGKLIIARCVKTEGALKASPHKSRTGNCGAGRDVRLVLLPPDELTTRDKRMIDCALQRLPAECRVYTVKMRDEIAAKQIMATRIRCAHIHVRAFCQIAVSAQVPHNA